MKIVHELYYVTIWKCIRFEYKQPRRTKSFWRDTQGGWHLLGWRCVCVTWRHDWRKYCERRRLVGCIASKFCFTQSQEATTGTHKGPQLAGGSKATKSFCLYLASGILYEWVFKLKSRKLMWHGEGEIIAKRYITVLISPQEFPSMFGLNELSYFLSSFTASFNCSPHPPAQK